MSQADPDAPAGASVPAVQTITFADLDGSAVVPTNGAAHALGAGGDLLSPLRQIRVKLTVRVGTAELSVGEILDAKAGQVIRLDRSLEQPVEVLLDGQLVARGTLVAADERFAVRITEVPLALDLTTAPSGGAR